MRSLQSTDEIRSFFHSNQRPIFYVNSTPFNLLGAEQWINPLQFINTIDSFDGLHPHVFVPDGAREHGLQGIEAANLYLLKHKAVADYLQRLGSGGNLLFLMFDEETEAVARQMGLTVCFPPAKLRRHLDSKVTTTRLANRPALHPCPMRWLKWIATPACARSHEHWGRI